jgi:hypothetical protein
MAGETTFLCIVYQPVLTTSVPKPYLTRYHFLELPDAGYSSIYNYNQYILVDVPLISVTAVLIICRDLKEDAWRISST